VEPRDSGLGIPQSKVHLWDVAGGKLRPGPATIDYVWLQRFPGQQVAGHGA
jgi:hypothetical protein